MSEPAPWDGEMTLEQVAGRMYAQQTAGSAPPWNQLGDVTRGVWLEMAQAEMFGDLA